MKKLIKSLTPPILKDLYLKYNFRKYGWHGEYKTWEKVEAVSTGYDTDEIIQKVKESALKVKKGKAVYERDSVIFDKIQYSWPLLAGLMFASTKCEGTPKVLDFGGSLGGTYFQNKKFLDRLEYLSWSIVEQKHFVEVGKVDFEDEKLKFYYDIESCIENERPNILLLSSVLQYFDKPYKLLDNFLKNNFEFILIDRTPFSKTNKKIKLQIVNPKIYKASYPCWFFDEIEFITYFERNNYNIIESFEALDGQSEEYIFKGFIIKKNI
jgi:putative methyltransferase (TIGR04325 family)